MVDFISKAGKPVITHNGLLVRFFSPADDTIFLFFFFSCLPLFRFFFLVLVYVLVLVLVIYSPLSCCCSCSRSCSHSCFCSHPQRTSGALFPRGRNHLFIFSSYFTLVLLSSQSFVFYVLVLVLVLVLIVLVLVLDLVFFVSCYFGVMFCKIFVCVI